MRKKLAVLFSLVLATLISMSMTSVVQADVSTYNWIGACYRGSDNFYGSTIIAYETGSVSELAVSVDTYQGPYGWELANVSAVKVGFDWGVNYTSTECSMDSPVQIEKYNSRVFTVSFTVPATTTASNLVRHSYTIYVEYVNSTTGSKKIIYTDTEDGSNFAVYSADQADAMECYTELTAVFAYSPVFSIAKAKLLWSDARAQNSLGTTYYQGGKFAEANATLHTASDLVDQAFEAEDDRGSKLEDAQMNYYNAAMIQAYAWLVLGIGMMLIGIGVIIYAVKKPKAS